jgi:hypothetical protein
MPDKIIIYLHPKKPTTGTEFTNSLVGLSITLTDMSVADPAGNQVIGTATYASVDPNNSIVQHGTPPTPLAVATATITVSAPAGYKEYAKNDLRLTLKRGAQKIVDRSLNYNVVKNPSPEPSLYVALPLSGAGLGASDAFVDIPTDGSPPSFQDLYKAVKTVLSADPAPPDIDAYIRSLTPQQCRHIAYEIVWNRTLLPMPAPPQGRKLEDLYTISDPTKTLDSDVETDRQKFESDLISYDTTNNTQAEILAGYVFALSAAMICEQKTTDAALAGFELPVLPGGTGKIATVDVILSA